MHLKLCAHAHFLCLLTNYIRRHEKEYPRPSPKGAARGVKGHAGLQVINVAAGGSLIQDCAGLFEGAIKHDYFPGAGWARDYLAHEIRIAQESRLHGCFGVENAMVNSMHHQAVERVGEGLVPTAWAPDGLIEAVEGTREGHFLVGVQWHPEMLLDDHEGTKRLFEEFIEAANQYHNANSLSFA
jgi:putative glutamine amidotransferase